MRQVYDQRPIERSFQARRRSQPRKRGRWLMMNAILYVTRTGCRWRMLPMDGLPSQSAVGRYPRWTRRAVGVAEFGRSRINCWSVVWLYGCRRVDTHSMYSNM
jgi:transposase